MHSQSQLSRIPISSINHELWRRGWLGHILHPEQIEAMHFIQSLKKTYAFLLCTRGFGKSYFLVCYYVWLCSMKKRRVWFLAATLDQVTRVFEKHLDEVREKYLPRELWPRKIGNTHTWQFPNGSIIMMAGVDQTKGRSLRGDGVDEIVCDEVGAWHECYSIIKGALYSIAERNNGRIVMSTTPPETAGHDSFRLYQECMTNETVFTRDVFHCSLYPQTRIEKVIEENQSHDDLESNKKGMASTFFQREYMCKFVTEENKRVIPEFKRERHVIGDTPRPGFYDAYCFMDLGFKAFTHVLFAYYDFRAATLVILDEIVQNHANVDNTTEDLTNKIKKKEAEWFPNKKPTAPGKVGIKRICDNDLQLINDITNTHKLPCIPVVKNFSKEAGNNELRLWFQQDRIKIHERCKRLISQLDIGIWKRNRKEYEPISGCGNLDGIDALVYGVRHVDVRSNPVPHRFNEQHNVMMNDFDYYIAPEVEIVPEPIITEDDFYEF